MRSPRERRGTPPAAHRDGFRIQTLEHGNSIPQKTWETHYAPVIRLAVELGLRPIELLHLSVRTDANSAEPYWSCSYRKRSGVGITWKEAGGSPVAACANWHR